MKAIEDPVSDVAVELHPMGSLPADRAAPRRSRLVTLRGVARMLSFRNTSLLYVGALFLIIFAFWIPDLFFTVTTWKTLLYQQAVTAVVALGFLLPFTAGNFDLSLGSQVGVASAMSGWLIVDHQLPVPVALLIAFAACLVIGVINGTLVEIVKIDAVIATLAMMSMIQAAGAGLTKGRQYLGLPRGFTTLSSRSFGGIPFPFVAVIVVGLVLWWLLRHTPAGRYFYAIGGNREAAALSGVRARRIVMFTFLASSAMAAIAGVMVTSRIGAGDFSVGAGYLFPAAAAVFLGSTQIRPGVFNVWGTVLSVYVLAIIVKGLQLGGAPFWLPDFMNGLALVIAVGVSGVASRSFDRRARAARRRQIRSVDTPTS